MKTYIRFLLWPLALFVPLMLFGLAFAGVDGSTTPGTAVPVAAATGWGLLWLTPYMPLLLPLLGGAQAVIVKWQTVKTGFWHSGRGHVVLVLFGAVVGGALDFLRKGDLTKTALIAAGGGAVAAFFGAIMKVGKEDGDVVAEPSKPAGGGSSGGVSAALFLALLSCFFAMPGCTTPGGAALGACELGQLPKTVQTLVALVTTALSGANWQQDLTALEPSAGGQLDCVVAAVVASMQKRGEITATGLTVVEHGRAWLARKGTK